MSLLFGKMKNMFLDRRSIPAQKNYLATYLHSVIKLSCCCFRSAVISRHRPLILLIFLYGC